MKRILSTFIIFLSLCLPVTSSAIICDPFAPTPGADWIFAGSMCENVLVVCPTSEYETIGAAMTAAAAGDTILVTEGTYVEAVVFTQDNITLKAYGAAESTIIHQATGTVVSFGTKSGCTLDGFTVRLSAATATEDRAIFSNNDDAVDYNTVKNSTITVDETGDAFALYGIDINDGAFRLLNNTITATQSDDHAVYAVFNDAANPFEVRGNTITVDQNATGAFVSAALWHTAGAGSILYAMENVITLDSTHTGVSIAYGIYASAIDNYISGNKISVIVAAAGAATAISSFANDTGYITGNLINATTTDSDAMWADFPASSIGYVTANNVVGDGIMGTGGTLYIGVNQVNGAGTGVTSTNFVTIEKSADTVTLTAIECSDTLITNRGWDGADDQTFTLPDADTVVGKGLKFKFLAVKASAATADTYIDTEGATTKIYLDGVAGTDGHRIWFEEIAIGEGFVCQTATIDGTTYDWFCDSINGFLADVGS